MTGGGGWRDGDDTGPFFVPLDPDMLNDVPADATGVLRPVSQYSYPLEGIVEVLGLMRVAGGHLDLSQRRIVSSEINRPGLQLTGYTEHFARDRLQVIGWTETAFLSGLDPVVRARRLDDYFALGFPALVVARGLHVMPDMVQAADRRNVPVFATDLATSDFAGRLNWLLIHALAPRVKIAAGLVDVYGEGVLIVGEEGIGKSETALELVRRGHRLIADDRVEVLRISEDHLRGRSPGQSRPLIQLPGIGGVDVEELFGAGSVKPNAAVSLVVVLEHRDFDKEYERVGIVERKEVVFGVSLDRITIPVQPGRNLAVIIEAAALDHRQRLQGYNAAADLLHRP
jgi:HPr kinase/phosphorylase